MTPRRARLWNSDRFWSTVRAMRAVFPIPLVIAICAAAAWAGDAPPDPLEGLRGGAKVEALVDLVVERQRALTSMRSEFIQHKSSELLLEPVTSEGEFLFLAPDTVRWNYAEPDEMIVVYADETLTTYRPGENVAQAVQVAERHSRFVRVLAGTQPLDDLEAQFRITMTDPGPPGPYRLRLDPIHRALKARLEVVHLEVDRQLLLPVAIEYVEADGDTTRYEFHDLELNVPMDEAAFSLSLDEDVRVETVDVSG